MISLHKYLPNLDTILDRILDRTLVVDKSNRLSFKFKKEDRKLCDLIKGTDNKTTVEEEIVKALDERLLSKSGPLELNGKGDEYTQDIGRRYCKLREIPLQTQKGYNAVAKFAIDMAGLKEIEQNVDFYNHLNEDNALGESPAFDWDVNEDPVYIIMVKGKETLLDQLHNTDKSKALKALDKFIEFYENYTFKHIKKVGPEEARKALLLLPFLIERHVELDTSDPQRVADRKDNLKKGYDKINRIFKNDDYYLTLIFTDLQPDNVVDLTGEHDYFIIDNGLSRDKRKAWVEECDGDEQNIYYGYPQSAWSMFYESIRKDCFIDKDIKKRIVELIHDLEKNMWCGKEITNPLNGDGEKLEWSRNIIDLAINYGKARMGLIKEKGLKEDYANQVKIDNSYLQAAVQDIHV